LRLCSGEAFAHRSTANEGQRNNPKSHPLAPIQEKNQKRADGTQSFLSALLISLTDIIKDMFPGLLAEDEGRIAVTQNTVSDHQSGSEENESHQHEYQNPHHR
jgi:hypothetical protein